MNNNANKKGGRNSWAELPDDNKQQINNNNTKGSFSISSSTIDNNDIDISINGCSYNLNNLKNVDNDMKENLMRLKHQIEDGHMHISHIPWFAKPKVRQFWMPKEMGGGSSLSHSHEERVATTNDLVLDLVMVYILNVLATLTVKKAEFIGGYQSPSGSSHRLLSIHKNENNQTNSSGIHHKRLDTYTDAQLVYAAIVDTAALFIPLFFCWIRLTRTLNKYEQNDVVHLFFFLINMIVFTLLGRSVNACGTEAETNGGRIGDPSHRVPCYEFVGFLQVSIFINILYMFYVRYFNKSKSSRLGIDYEIAMMSFKIFIYSFIHVGLYDFIQTGRPKSFVIAWWGAISFEILVGLIPAVWSLFSKIPVWSMKHTCICLRLCHSPEEETSRGLGFGLIPLHTHLTTERLSLFVILSLGEFLAGADVGGKSHFPGQWKISIAYVNSISSNKPKKRISSLTTHHSLIHIPHVRYFPQYYYIDGWN